MTIFIWDRFFDVYFFSHCENRTHTRTSLVKFALNSSHDLCKLHRASFRISLKAPRASFLISIFLTSQVHFFVWVILKGKYKVWIKAHFSTYLSWQIRLFLSNLILATQKREKQFYPSYHLIIRWGGKLCFGKLTWVIYGAISLQICIIYCHELLNTSIQFINFQTVLWKAQKPAFVHVSNSLRYLTPALRTAFPAESLPIQRNSYKNTAFSQFFNKTLSTLSHNRLMLGRSV